MIKSSADSRLKLWKLMTNWIQVKGVVTAGYGVVSGQSGDSYFPEGTIAMQKAYFQEQGLDLIFLSQLSLLSS